MTPKLDVDPRRQTTSIKIYPEIWKKAKLVAVQKDMQLSELVEEAIDYWIKSEVKRKTKT